MTPEEHLEILIQDIRVQQNAVMSPPPLEARLREAARRSRAKSVERRWMLTCAASLVLGVSVWWMARYLPVETRQETVDQTAEFRAVPGSEGLPAPSTTIIVRMEVGREDLSLYGWGNPPKNIATPVTVDFVIDEDGLPRAIRLAP